MCEEITFIKWLWIIEESNWFGSIIGSIPIILMGIILERNRRKNKEDNRG